jgi:hypothetical protein
MKERKWQDAEPAIMREIYQINYMHPEVFGFPYPVPFNPHGNLL